MTATASPSTAAVAQELVNLCRQGRNLDAVNKLYSPRILSIESSGGPDMPAEQTGIEAVQYTFDTTFKPTGERRSMTEMALYTVKDGKIVREQFFYNPKNQPGE